MDGDTIVGCVLIVVSLGVLTCLVVWSRRTIHHIANGTARSAREIRRELRGDR